MLEFFRRYQRAFFIVITVVIVISFSFFGTFQAFSGKEQDDSVVFTAVDGSKVRRTEVSDMVNFLTSDSHDFLFSGAMAGNALNDGVIASDVLESGLAIAIGDPFMMEIGSEQQSRLDRERRYKPYSHPRAPFLTAEQIWAYYAPDIKTNYDRLRGYDNAQNKDAFQTRVNLFVAERRFPSIYLRQFLRYQEASHKWLPQDPNLMHQDLSLFGYHSIQDWFGRQFVELVAQFVINSAKVAEQKGYTITKDETMASLYRNAEEAWRQARTQGLTQAPNAQDFFQEQLRRLGMDQARAINVWKDVLLFRTLYFENADSILVDTASYKDFYHHLNEYVDIDLYQLPKDLRFSTLGDLEQFVLYLNAVRPPVEGSKNQNPLAIPMAFATVQQVKKVYPELVERTFTVRMQEANKEELQKKIGVRQTWEWQVQDPNWQDLKKRYPELAKGGDDTQEARLKLLDSLDPARRATCDTSSRQKIVDQHPEWLEQVLNEATAEVKEITVREQGGKPPFTGFKDGATLISLLDKAPLNEQSKELAQISQDNVHYFKIEVIERQQPERILTFSEAKADATMDAILNKTLEASYPRVRSKQPALFLKDNGEWKPFKEVKDNIALYHFEELFRLIDHKIAYYKEKMPNYTDWASKENAILAVSLLPYVQEEQNVIKEKIAKAEEWPDIKGDAANKSGPEQFSMIKVRERQVLSGPNFAVNPELAFSLERETMSPLTCYQNSGPSFFIVLGKGFLPSDGLVRAKVLEERSMVGREAVLALAGDLLTAMQKKGAYNIELSANKAASNDSR